jgi:hypothetical protein
MPLEAIISVLGWCRGRQGARDCRGPAAQAGHLELERITGFGGTITAHLLLTDQDAPREPLPLLAQRFAAARLRHRTPTFACEASVKLIACEAKVRGGAYRGLAAPDEVARACTLVVRVKHDVG